MLAALDGIVTWVAAKAPAITALAAGVGATVAVLGYRKWHPESVGKRKIELAEDILADFYRSQEVIRWARFPGGFAGEGETRIAPANETPHEKELRDGIYRTIERLHAERELFTGLQAKKYRAMAYFDKHAAKPFDDIKRIHGDVVRAATMLLRHAGNELAPEKLQDEWETTIGWRGFSETDQLSNDLEAIVRDVEDFYGAWLMRKGVPT